MFTENTVESCGNSLYKMLFYLILVLFKGGISVHFLVQLYTAYGVALLELFQCSELFSANIFPESIVNNSWTSDAHYFLSYPKDSPLFHVRSWFLQQSQNSQNWYFFF